MSFLDVKYNLVSFFGGDPPPVIRISFGKMAMAAEH